MNKIILTLFLFGLGLSNSGTLSAVETDLMLPAAQQTVLTLNALIERAIDGQRGFQEAAQYAGSPDLKSRFADISNQRDLFTQELKTQVEALGHEPVQRGTVSGTVRRQWLDVRTAGPYDDKAVLLAVKTGEEAALRAYRKALGTHLPVEIQNMVEKQSEKIEASRNWIHQRLTENPK